MNMICLITSKTRPAFIILYIYVDPSNYNLVLKFIPTVGIGHEIGFSALSTRKLRILIEDDNPVHL